MRKDTATAAELAEYESRHRYRSERRAALRAALRDSSSEDERNAVILAEYGHVPETIVKFTGISPEMASILVRGD